MVQAQLSQAMQRYCLQFEKDEKRMLKPIQQLVCHNQKDELLQINPVSQTHK